MNPWRLPMREAQALDAKFTHDSHAAAAASLGLASKTLEVYLQRAYTRMRLREGNTTAHALFVMWGKWRLTGNPYAQWSAPRASNV